MMRAALRYAAAVTRRYALMRRRWRRRSTRELIMSRVYAQRRCSLPQRRYAAPRCVRAHA